MPWFSGTQFPNLGLLSRELPSQRRTQDRGKRTERPLRVIWRGWGRAGVCSQWAAGLPACHHPLLLWETMFATSHGLGAETAPTPTLTLPEEHPVQGLGSNVCGLWAPSSS